MTKEIIQSAEDLIELKAHTEFGKAVDRMCDFNERKFKDNPKAIVEELNTLIPWVYEKPMFHYEEVNGAIIGVSDE